MIIRSTAAAALIAVVLSLCPADAVAQEVIKGGKGGGAKRWRDIRVSPPQPAPPPKRNYSGKWELTAIVTIAGTGNWWATNRQAEWTTLRTYKSTVVLDTYITGIDTLLPAQIPGMKIDAKTIAAMSGDKWQVSPIEGLKQRTVDIEIDDKLELNDKDLDGNRYKTTHRYSFDGKALDMNLGYLQVNKDGTVSIDLGFGTDETVSYTIESDVPGVKKGPQPAVPLPSFPKIRGWLGPDTAVKVPESFIKNYNVGFTVTSGKLKSPTVINYMGMDHEGSKTPPDIVVTYKFRKIS